MKKLLFFAFLLCSALAFTVDIQPNFIRALPSESFSIAVIITADSSGFYSLKVEGSGVDFAKNYEILPGQIFQIPISVTAPETSGDYPISARVAFADETVMATATVQVIESSSDSELVNSTLYSIRWELDELKIRAQDLGDDQVAYSRLMEAETLINNANNSYLTGHLIAAQSDMDEAMTKIEQAKTILKFAEQSRMSMNLNLLLIGVLIILIAFVLKNYVK